MRSNEFHGNYTKHYYNGTERICSRLGDQTFSLSSNVAFTPQTQQRLATRIMQVDQNFRAELLELVEAGDVPVEFPNVLNLITLLPSGSNSNSNSNPNPNSNPHTNANTSNDIFYYHTNHLGSTAFVTDNNATITQGFLYAPFGEITTEYNASFANGIIPKYAFNAKELDEETGMYYYEARYMAPPTFISRDPHFERYFWTTPYGYCNNNPLKYVDPTGMDGEITVDEESKTVSVRANFYYNSSQLEQSKCYNIKSGFQEALNSWSTDIKSALATMGFDEYTVNIQFEWKEVDIGTATGKDAIKIIQSAANADPIGNSIVHDESVSVTARVSNSKHLSANMIKAGLDNAVFFGTDCGNSAMHEIGHFFGLRDRYNPNNPEHAPYIKGDLMSADSFRDNAVAPFIRIMNCNNLLPGSNKSVLINKNNKEAK